jgi:hypothetical protein
MSAWVTVRLGIGPEMDSKSIAPSLLISDLLKFSCYKQRSLMF